MPQTDISTLYLVPVPIGNLQDITLRAVSTLRSVDFIIAEDTRYSLKLLNHLGIKKRLVSYFKPKENEKAGEILRLLSQANNRSAALITDSGSPGISDPGFILIRKAIDAGVDVIPLPGPTAFVPALTASGIDPSRFLFLGFPPRKKNQLKQFLNDACRLPYTLIFYESPRRVHEFLETASEVFGNRPFALVKELTKMNEKVIRGNLNKWRNIVSSEVLLGEMVVIIEGSSPPTNVKGNGEEKPQLNSLEDLFTYFKETFQMSRNELKKILMKRD